MPPEESEALHFDDFGLGEECLGEGEQNEQDHHEEEVSIPTSITIF